MNSLKLVFALFVASLLTVAVVSQPKVGFVFSGGGSRIAEEVAVMEALMTGSYPNGVPLKPTFTSGTSAGSICTVALSALVQSMDGKSARPFTFENVKEMIFNMTVGSVVDMSPLGIYKILTYNVKQGYILDTSPLRALLTKYVTQMGYKFMRDLYLPTCISVVDSNSGWPVRLCSDDPAAMDLQIVDVVMASAAMPVVFPPQQIPGLSENFFVDGGVGIDMIPTDVAYQRNLDAVYIITRQWEVNDGNQLPAALKDIKLLANALNTINNLLQAAFFSGLSSASVAKVPSYSYIPVLDQNFGVLDFDKGKLMYEVTRNWTRENAPICMNCP
jgi:predicted acylesterase/phospholipase RssA